MMYHLLFSGGGGRRVKEREYDAVENHVVSG